MKFSRHPEPGSKELFTIVWFSSYSSSSLVWLPAYHPFAK